MDAERPDVFAVGLWPGREARSNKTNSSSAEHASVQCGEGFEIPRDLENGVKLERAQGGCLGSKRR